MTFIDPVKLVRDAGNMEEAELFLSDLLANAGYISQKRPLSVLVESLFGGIPLLIEGDPGAGKTALAQALAAACSMPLFKLSCAEGLTRQTVLYQWNFLNQRIYMEQERQRGRAFEEIQPELYTRQFLDLAPVVAALDASNYGVRPILLIDEIDKLDPKLSDLLLEALSEWCVTVEFLRPEPRICVENPKNRPVVILTSNNIRNGVSAPLRNRAIYTHIASPVLSERIRIFHQHARGISQAVLLQLVTIFEQISLMRLTHPPGLRNGTRWARVLAEKDVPHIDLPLLRRNLCYLVQNQSDLNRLEAQAALLFESSLNPPAEIVSEICALYGADDIGVSEPQMALLAVQALENQFDEHFPQDLSQ